MVGSLSEAITCSSDVDRLLWQVGICHRTLMFDLTLVTLPIPSTHISVIVANVQLGDKTRAKIVEIIDGEGVYWRNTVRAEDERLKVGDPSRLQLSVGDEGFLLP